MVNVYFVPDCKTGHRAQGPLHILFRNQPRGLFLIDIIPAEPIWHFALY